MERIEPNHLQEGRTVVLVLVQIIIEEGNVQECVEHCVAHSGPHYARKVSWQIWYSDVHAEYVY